MKVKLKPCAGDDCNGALRPIWKRDDQGRGFCKYCWMKSKPAQLKPTRKPLPSSRKPIKKESEKRRKDHKIYSEKRKDFLQEHPVCGMAIKGICVVHATEIQHLKGRGIYYLDIDTWLQSCSPCHRYATDHPEQAIENGWALLRLTKK